MRGKLNMDNIEIGEVFTISDDENNEHEVEVIAKLTIEGTEYVSVSFSEDLQQESGDDIDIFFLKIDPDGDFSAIESDEEFDKVSTAFDEVLEEED
jgi:uncharacterized protein YrzB (UPF0473 family)